MSKMYTLPIHLCNILAISGKVGRSQDPRIFSLFIIKHIDVSIFLENNLCAD